MDHMSQHYWNVPEPPAAAAFHEFHGESAPEALCTRYHFATRVMDQGVVVCL